MRVAAELIQEVEKLRGNLIPDDVSVSITRDYGETANHKVDELVNELLIAIATVIVLLALALGPKEAFIVAIAVPMTLAVTLLLDLIFGYTINRVTLFALILSLGLLVDDPIVDVENIFRHFKLRREPPLEATLTAVDEVRPPTILATFAVIVSFLPMFFITGMMGPYMRPMAFNVPVAMLMSLLVAFTITPWASYYLLRSEYGKHGEEPFDITQSAIYRVYRATLSPLLTSRRRAAVFLLAVVLAFLGSALLAVTRAVPLKMLPFDNKNEFQLVIDMPRGTTLETTDAAARDLGRYLATVAEVTDFTTYVGWRRRWTSTAWCATTTCAAAATSPTSASSFLPKEERMQQSHAIALRIRPEIERIGREHGANVKIVEMPPGPPVFSTLVAEVYGPLDAPYADLIAAARRVRGAMEQTAGVVDVDDYVEAPHDQINYRLDREKAALSGVTVAQAAQTLQAALGGKAAGRVHIPTERLPLELSVRLPRALRSSVSDLLAVRVKSATVTTAPARWCRSARSAARPLDRGEQTHLPQEPAAGGVRHRGHGRAEPGRGRARPVPLAAGAPAARRLYRRPRRRRRVEDHRRRLPRPRARLRRGPGGDLRAAGGADRVVAHAAGHHDRDSADADRHHARLLAAERCCSRSRSAAYANPVFFTATGMIGMIALAGIVVRNSIILIDFIEHIRQRDPAMPLAEAIIEAGATRLRPIFLTAGAAMLGSFVITLDPIFSGLAWSFIFGIFASTAFSLVVVPLVYYLLHARKDAADSTQAAV